MSGVDAMTGSSGIEWCGETWEVTAGCSMVSSGCANCYAETLVGGRLAGAARRRKKDGKSGAAVDVSLEVIEYRSVGGGGDARSRWNGEVRELAMNLEQPLRRKTPTVYFVNSRSDLFHEGVGFAYIDKVFAVMALCPQHRFLVLTKRPERMREYFDAKGIGLDPRIQDAAWHCFKKQLSCSIPLPNVWLGTSVEDHDAAIARLTELMHCPAAGRFASVEPLLEEVDLNPWFGDVTGHWLCGAEMCECCSCRIAHAWPHDYEGLEYIKLDWVIVGGESGRESRICEQQWIRSIVAQCKESLVPVFVKQLGKRSVLDRESASCWRELGGIGAKGELVDKWPEDLRVREVPDDLMLEGGG